MKTLLLQGIDDKTILLKGAGRNQKLEAISVDRLPGSILIVSNKMSASVRIYCIYNDYDATWVFAFASTKEANNQKPLDYMMDQTWGKDGQVKLEITVPDDITIELEGEFAEDIV